MVPSGGPFPLCSHLRCAKDVVKTCYWAPWQGWDVKGKRSTLLEGVLGEKILLNWSIFYQQSVWLCRFQRWQTCQMLPLVTQGTVFQEGHRALIWRWVWRWCPGSSEPWLAMGDPFTPPPVEQLDQQPLGKMGLIFGRAWSWWSDGHLVGSPPKHLIFCMPALGTGITTLSVLHRCRKRG